jgi:hypothetical protein
MRVQAVKLNYKCTEGNRNKVISPCSEIVEYAPEMLKCAHNIESGDGMLGVCYRIVNDL